MWNICRSQCPSYWMDHEIFGRSSTPYSTNKGRSTSSIKPVTTLSPSFWLPESTVSETTVDENITSKTIVEHCTIDNRKQSENWLSSNEIHCTTLPPIVTQQPRNGVVDSGNISVKLESNNHQQTFKKSNKIEEEDKQLEQQEQQSKNQSTTSTPNRVTMDNGMSKSNLTEYKRAYQWSLPMVDPPPIKPEPLISNYQMSYGSAIDNVDGHLITGRSSTKTNNNGTITLNHSLSTNTTNSTNTSRSPTPGTVINANKHTEPICSYGTSVLFDHEPPPKVEGPMSPIGKKQSEYHAKFKPFDEYVYVENEGKFRKQTPATKMVAASSVTPSATKAWFCEVEERCRQACKYRARSQNGATPINPDQPWDGVTIKDRNLQALALATQMIVEEKKAERKQRSVSAKPTNRSTHGRNLNSAPSSLRDTHSIDSARSNVTNGSNVPSHKPVVRKAPLSKPSAPITDRNNNVGPAKPPIIPKKVRPTNTSAPATATTKSADQKPKVWIKPKKKIGEDDVDRNQKPITPEAKKVDRNQKPISSELKKNSVTDTKPINAKQFDAEPKSVPLRTTEVKSPEQLTGIKSPSPESWKVSIEKGGLQWVNGSTPVNFVDGKNDLSSNGSGTVTNLIKPVPINGSIN